MQWVFKQFADNTVKTPIPTFPLVGGRPGLSRLAPGMGVIKNYMQTADRITLQSCQNRVRVHAGDTLIADTRQAIELHETDYPVRYYIPRHDIAMDHLTTSATVTHCPYKGDATYFTVTIDSNKKLTDAAWSYEQPLADMQTITGYIAFDDNQVRIELE